MSKPADSPASGLADWPTNLCTSLSPLPAHFLIPPSATSWDYCTVWIPPPPLSLLPHPLPASLACSWLTDIPKLCCYDLINGIWLAACIPEMGVAFWKTDNGWGRVLPVCLWKQYFPPTPEDECVLHLTQRLVKKYSQLGWHAKLSVDQFVLSLAGRVTHTPVRHRALCQHSNLSQSTSVQINHHQQRQWWHKSKPAHHTLS